jgi:hypothetical protein
MRALNLDFRYQDRTARRVGIGVLAAGLIGGALAWSQYQQVSEDVSRAEASVRKSGLAARKKGPAAVTPADAQKLTLEVKNAGAVLSQLGMPWSELFAGMEGASAQNVALLSVESDTDKQNIKIAGEAKDLRGVLAYMRELQARPMIVDVYLQSHQLQQQDPQHPIRFALAAVWRTGQ